MRGRKNSKPLTLLMWQLLYFNPKQTGWTLGETEQGTVQSNWVWRTESQIKTLKIWSITASSGASYGGAKVLTFLNSGGL